MKHHPMSVFMASVLTLGLAACSSTPMGSDTASSNGSSATGEAVTSSTKPSANTASTTADSSAASVGSSTVQDLSSGSSTATQALSISTIGVPNSVVTLIETVARTPTTTGSTGTSGSAGTTSGNDKAYRVTVRLDDGSSRVVMQDWMPSYRVGERVRTIGDISQR